MEYILRKRLIFAFYLEDGSFDNVINKLHFKYLREYIHIFDEVIVCINMDDLSRTDLITRLEKVFCSIYTGDITFRLYHNTDFREAKIFHDEIVNKMGTLDGLTFFAHNKGLTNGYYQLENVKHWIGSMYYFNFQIDDLNRCMNYCDTMFYGALMCDINNEYYATRCFNHWMYCGTFFWGNYQYVKEYVRNANIQLPDFFNRWYDECFPGNIVDMRYAMSYKQRYVIGSPVLGDNIDEWLRICYMDEDYNNFIENYNNINNSADVNTDF